MIFNQINRIFKTLKCIKSENAVCDKIQINKLVKVEKKVYVVVHAIHILQIVLFHFVYALYVM